MGLSAALLTAMVAALYQTSPTAAQAPQHTDLTVEYDCENVHIDCSVEGSSSFAVSEPVSGRTLVPVGISASPALLAPVTAYVAVMVKDSQGSAVNPDFVSVTVNGVAIDNGNGLLIASGQQITDFELALSSDAISERESVFSLTFLTLGLRDVLVRDGLTYTQFRARQNDGVPDTISPAVYETSAPIIFTVRQSDQPFGAVALMQTSSSISVDEPETIAGLTETDVIATITRTNCPGRTCDGSVEVTLALAFAGGYDSADASDVVLVEPTVTCVNSNPCSVTISVIADDVAEIAEAFSLRIVSTTLIGFPGSVPTMGPGLMYTISPNDNPEGFVAFEMADVAVSEPGTALVNVVRTGSCFGSVTAFYSIVYGTADPSDLVDGDGGGTVSGSRTFPDEPGCADGQAMAINIPIQDDTDVEGSETFEVVLIETDLTVGELTRATVTIGPNDLAGGVFRLLAPATARFHERDDITFTLQRSTGTYGAATVSWAAYYYADGAFQTWITGEVAFGDGDTTGTIIVFGDDDEIPEVDVTYQFRLVNVASALGSGLAVSDAEMSQQDIVVTASDFPYGRYSVIAPAATTYEEGDTVQFTVHRTDGLVGDVTVRWAVDVAHAADVRPNTGTVTFQASGNRNEIVTVAVTADMIPELAETIAVSISMVSGDAASTTIDVSTLADDAVPMSFVVDANDYVYGLFQFSESVVDGVEGNAYTLNVNRIGGDPRLVGSASIAVTWRWVGEAPAADQATLAFSSSSAAPNTVVFASDVYSQPATVSILTDAVPETGAIYTAELTGVSITLDDGTVLTSVAGKAGIGSIDDADFNTQLTVREQASGSPLGVFDVVGTTANDLAGTAHPEGETVSFYIDRGALTTFTAVRVAWSIAISGGATDSTAPSFSQSSGSVVFAAGETVSAAIEVTITDDRIASLHTSYDITIGVVGDLTAGPRTFTYAQAGGVTASAFAVLPDDEAGGTFLFSSAAGADLSLPTRLSEPETGSATYVIDHIARFGDLRGEATVTLQLSPSPTNAVLAATSVTFRDGESLKNVSITVYGYTTDVVTQPFNVDFQTVMVAVDPQAGADRWRGAQQISAEIAYSGSPFGTVAMQGETTIDVSEGAEIAVVISRPTDTAVSWSTPFTVNIVGGGGQVQILEQATFADSNAETAAFRLLVTNDDGAEAPETVVLTISAIGDDTAGAYAIGASSQLTLNIAGNGNYRGRFAFAAASRATGLSVAEGEPLVLDVTRDEGFTGAVDVPWHIVFASDPLADARYFATEADFAVVSGTASFSNGQTTQIISITPTSDGIAEVGQTFSVALDPPVVRDPSAAGNVAIAAAASVTADISLLSNGNPQGTVTLSASTLSLAEGGSMSVTVTRSGELNFEAQVIVTATLIGPEPEWAAISLAGTGIPAFNPTTGVATFILTFADLEGGSQMVTISMADDVEPEVASQVEITIESLASLGLPGAETAGSVTVAIPESDTPAGVIGFRGAGATPIAREGDAAGTVLQLVRGPGTEGSVSVDWAVGAGSGEGSDLVDASGTVTFANGAGSGIIDLRVADDSRPELEETLVVVLSNPTGGAVISSASTTLVVIEENDAPYGRFALSSAAIETRMGERVMRITIGRTAGTAGTVDVPVTIDFSEGGSDCAPAATAITPGPHMVRFLPGNATGTIYVATTAGVRLSTADTFCVSLGAPGLLDETETADAPALVVDATATSTTVAISELHANGDITITASADSVAEGSAITYTVNRSGGVFGSVSLEISIAGPVPGQTQFEETNPRGRFTLLSGRSSTSFALEAIDDTAPELEMRLNATATILAGSEHVTLNFFHAFTIPANDDPYGLFSLEAAADGSRDIETVMSFGTHTVSMVVVRRQGMLGTVTVRVQTVSAAGNRGGMAIGPAQADRDYVSYDQVLTFAGDITEIPIELTVIGSGPSSENSNFAARITVESSAEGEVRVAQSEVEVHILTCPECTAYFDDPTAVRFLNEVEGIQSVNLRRDFQAYGELVIGWIITPESATNAFAMDITDLGCADTASYNCTFGCGGYTANNDNQCGYYGNAVFAAGQDTTTIDLRVIDDAAPELLKNGILRITHVIRGEGTTSTTAHSVPLQILPSDFPYGSFSVTADESAYDEPLDDVADDEATFTVTRADGTLGAIRLQYTTDLADPLAAIFGPPESGTRVDGDDAVDTMVSSVNGAAAAQCAALCWQSSECQAFSITPSLDNGAESHCYTAPSARSAVLVGDDNLFYTIDPTKSRDYARAGRDFVRTTGPVVFADADTVKRIRVPLHPDAIPELVEFLTVRIVGIDFDDGETRVVAFAGLDTSSWMRIDATAGTATTQIVANDFPHGVFEFAPQAECTTAPPCIVVDEVPGNAAATYEIDIVRHYGTFGEVTVQWNVASPLPGVSIPDGTITFAEHETRKTVSITVIDDDEPEPEQSIVVYLEQAGQPESRTFITVVVGASDDVFGLFSLLQTSSDTTVEEGNSVAFEVRRTIGFMNDQVVRWRVTGGYDQVVVSEGELTFLGAGNGETGTQTLPFEVVIAADEIPEEEQNIQVTIFLPPTRCPDGRCGRTSDASDATFVLAESDYPYGTFRFASRSVYVEERDDFIELVLLRLGGDLGQRLVSWMTIEGTASDGEDFFAQPSWTEILFADGDRSKTIRIQVVDDLRSESSETFQVYIRDAMYAADAGTQRADWANYTEQVTVTIGPSDDGQEYGVFGFELDGAVAYEPGPATTGSTDIVLSRGGGTFGSVTVSYAVVAATAFERFISVADGRSAVPEDMVRSSVVYSDLEGCARSCFSNTFSVIAENFLYRPSPSGDNEPGTCMTLSGRAITIDDVIPAQSSATWNFYTVDSAALLHYAVEGVDFAGATGTVEFESGQETKTLSIGLPMADMVAEASEMYRIELTGVEMVGIAGDGPELTTASPAFDVTIPVNDNFDGTIGITSAVPVTLAEGDSHFVTIRRGDIVNPAVAQQTPFEAPDCADVWNPAAPPAVASATVIGTVAYLDSIGSFSEGNGPVLGGTTPWSVYLRVAVASSFGALRPTGSTAAEQQCIDTFEIAMGETNEFTANITAEFLDIPNGADGGNPRYESLAAYISSQAFLELRVCPCYNMMPRELFEHMNCAPTDASSVSLSQIYLHCQAVDTTATYADHPSTNLMPLNRDETQIENWQGCMDPTFNTFFQCGYQPGDETYMNAIVAHNLGSGSRYVPPSSTNPYDFLDAVAGTCTTMPLEAPPSATPVAFNWTILDAEGNVATADFALAHGTLYSDGAHPGLGLRLCGRSGGTTAFLGGWWLPESAVEIIAARDSLPELEERFTFGITPVFAIDIDGVVTNSFGVLSGADQIELIVTSEVISGGNFAVDDGNDGLGATLIEGQSVTWTIFREDAALVDIPVSWSIVAAGSNTADPAAEFETAAGTILFPAGAFSLEVDITAKVDEILDVTQAFEFAIAVSDSRATATTNTVGLAIAGNGDTFGIDGQTFELVEGAQIEIPVVRQTLLSGADAGQVTVAWSASGLPARAIGASGTLVFDALDDPNGDTQYIVMSLPNDELPELEAVVQVRLTGTTGGATGVTHDASTRAVEVHVPASDDAYGIFTLVGPDASTPYAEGSSADFHVHRTASAPDAGDVNVGILLTLAAGTAVGDFDFVGAAVAGAPGPMSLAIVVVVPGGSASASFTVHFLDTDGDELEEAWSARLIGVTLVADSSVLAGVLPAVNTPAAFSVALNGLPRGTLSIGPAAAVACDHEVDTLELTVTRTDIQGDLTVFYDIRPDWLNDQPVGVVDELGETFELIAGNPISSGIPITEEVSSWSVESAPVSMAPGGKVLVSTSPIGVVISDAEDFSHVQRLDVPAIAAQLFDFHGHWYLFVAHGGALGCSLYSYSPAGVAIGQPFAPTPVSAFPAVASHGRAAMFDVESIVVAGGTTTTVLEWTNGLGSAAGTPHFVDVTDTMLVQLPAATAVAVHPTYHVIILATAAGVVHVSQTAQGLVLSPASAAASCPGATSLTPFDNLGLTYVAATGPACSVVLRSAYGDDVHTLELMNDMASTSGQNFKLYPVTVEDETVVLSIYELVADDLNSTVDSYRWSYDGPAGFVQFDSLHPKPGRSTVAPVTLGSADTGFSVMLMEQDHMSVRTNAPTDAPSTSEPTSAPTFEDTAPPSAAPTAFRLCAEIGGLCGGPEHAGPTQCIEGTFCGAVGDEGNFVCRWHDGFHDECDAERPCNATVGFFCDGGRCASSRLCSAAPTAVPTSSAPSGTPTRGPTITDIITDSPTSAPTITTERMHYCNTISCARRCTGPDGVLQGTGGAECAWSSDRMRCVDVSYDSLTITTADELGMCTPTSFAPTAMPTRMPTALARIGYFTTRFISLRLVPKDVQDPVDPVFFEAGAATATITIHINRDGVPEREETFTVVLLGGDDLAVGATISPDFSESTVTLCQNPGIHGVVGFDDASIHRARTTTMYEPEIDAQSTGPIALELQLTRWGYSRALGLTACRIAWEVTGNAGLADLLVGSTSGVVSFAEGVTMLPLILALAEDDIPEFEAEYTLTLSETGDGCGVVNYGNRASVQFFVAMSDEPEGAIQFAAPRVYLDSHPAIGEQVTASTSLLRAFDAFSEEAVTVSYTIHPGVYFDEPQRSSESVSVADYFAAASGEVVFPTNSDRNAEQSIPFVLTVNRRTAVVGAAIRFRVELQAANPAALISFTQRTLDIYIPATTGAYGSVSLGAAVISTDPNPATPTRTLSFEAIRVGGDFRELSAVYEIDHVSAAGVISADTATMLVGGRRSRSLSFADGGAAAIVNVELATNVRIEAGGSFRISLGRVVVVGCDLSTMCPPAPSGVSMTVAQIPADAANGIIRFVGDASTLYTLYEPPASPSSARLGLVRNGGTFGTDVVRLTLSGVVNAAAEVTLEETVTFAMGDVAVEADVAVTGDDAPDFDQALAVTATASSSVTVLLDGANVVSMIIKGNDNPHGEAGFAVGRDTVVFVTNVTHRGLSVAFERTGNAAGNATVSYSLSSSTEAVAFLPSDSAQITFATGDVGITTVFVALTASSEVPVGTVFTATLAGGRPEVTDAVETSPIEFTDGISVAASVATTFDAHTYGIISVRTDASAVREGGEAVAIVERSNSTIMLATEVTIFTQSGTANAVLDFAEVSRTISFAAGQRTVPIAVAVLDDADPELAETFLVAVSSPLGAVLGTESVSFNILANDGINGTVSFAPSEVAMRDVSEPAGAFSRHVFEVIREPRGMPVSISWSAAGDDCAPTGGLIEFTSLDHILTFAIEIPGDTAPEQLKTITLSLSANDDDAITVAGLTELVVNIPANDAITVATLDDGSVGTDRVLRYFVSPDGAAPYTLGYTLSWGDVPAGRSVQPCNFPIAASQGRADGSNDGGSCTATSVVGTDGILPIPLSSGSYLVEGEAFELVLTSASNADGAALPFDAASVAEHITSVYAADGAISFAEGSLAIAVAEPDSGAIAVTLTVLRTGGLYTPGGDGSVELEWVSNARGVTSLTPRGNILSFDNATTMKTINLQLAADSIPEIEERVIITLGQVRYCTLAGDCQLLDDRMVAANTKRSTVVIAPSGSPYGIVQFAESHTLVTLANQIISLSVNRTMAGSSVAGSYGSVLVHWSAQQLQYDTLPLINMEGDITLADGQSTGAVELDLVGAGFWDPGYDYKNFTVTLTIDGAEGELGGQASTSVAVVGDGAIDLSASNSGTCAIYQNAACLGIADAEATAHSRCLASLAQLDVAAICGSQLQRLVDDAAAVAAWANARPYPVGAGAESYHALLDSWLSIPGMAPLATSLIGKFAVSLLGDCGSGGTGGCGCERSSLVAGSDVKVYASKRNPAAIVETPNFPPGVSSTPSVTLPADDLLDLAGAQRLNAANCLSYYYVENAAADLEMPATADHVLSGSLTLTVGIGGLAAPAVGGPTAAAFPNGAQLTFRVVAESRNAPQCAYFARGGWSTNGCTGSLDRDSGENLVTCRCDHMGSAFEASYGVLLNEPKPISQDVLVGNVVVMVGAAAMFFVSIARTETRVKEHAVVASGFSAAVFMANLFWIVNLVLVSEDATDDTSLTAIGLMLHFFALGLIGSIVATMDFLFHAIPGGSDAEARARFVAAGLPGGWVAAIVVVILYILVALETDGPTLYDDMLSNGRIAFLHTDAGLYACFVIEAVMGFLLTVYMVIMMQWEPIAPADGTDTAPVKYAQSKKTLIFAAMWAWVPLVVSVATALSDSDAGQFLLLVVLVIHGLIFFWMAFSEMTGTDETYSTKTVDTTANPVFGGRDIGTPGAMTPSLEQSFVSNVSAMDQSFASGGMSSPLPVNMPGAVYSDPGGGGYIDLASNPDPAEFDDLIFKLRGASAAKPGGGGNTSSM